MYLCYVDESGDTGPRGSRHLLLGAAAIFEGRWSYVRDDFSKILRDAFAPQPPPREIHCADVRGGRNEFAPLGHAKRAALLTAACNVVTSMLDTEVRLFTVIVDKPAWFARNPGRQHDDLYREAFEELVNRFDLFLRRRHAEGQPSKGLMIADPHTTGLTKALKADLGQFQLHGTRWANIYNVVETIVFLDSHESPGLQMADLCAYAVWRLVEFGDPSLAHQIAIAFDREPLTAQRAPGKWHGVKYLGHDTTVEANIRNVWAPPHQ